MSVFTGNDMWFLRYLFGLLMIAYISKRIFKNTLVAALLPMVLLFSLTRTEFSGCTPIFGQAIVLPLTMKALC